MPDGPDPQGLAPPPPRFRARKLWPLAVLVVIVYSALLAAGNSRALVDTLSTMRPWALPGAVALVLTGYSLRIVRWRLFLTRLGRPTRWTPAGLTFLSGFALAITPAKLGELVKVYYLWRRTATPSETAVAVIVAERSLDLAALAAIMAITAGWAPHVSGWVGPVLLALVVAAVLALRSRQAVALLLMVLGRLPVVRRGADFLRTTHDQVRPLLSGALLFLGPLLGLAAWALEPVAMWILAWGLGIEVSLATCAFIFTAATLAGVLAIIPGGLGVTEGGMVALLVLDGVPLAPASALTLLVRVSTLWLSVLLGLGSIVALNTTRALPQPVPAADDA